MRNFIAGTISKLKRLTGKASESEKETPSLVKEEPREILTVAEKEYYQKLLYLILQLDQKERHAGNKSLGEKTPFDLLMQIIAYEKNNPGILNDEALKAQFQILGITENTNSSVKIVIDRNYRSFSKIIDRYCSELILIDFNQIEEKCQEIENEGLKENIDSEWLTQQVQNLRKKMVLELGSGNAYRSPRRKFNQNFQIEETVISSYLRKYIDLIRSIKGYFQQNDSNLPDYNHDLLEIIADLIIKNEGLNIFDRPALIKALKAHKSFPKKVRVNLFEEKNYDEKNNRRFFEIYKETLKDLIDKGICPRETLPEKAIELTIPKIGEDRFGKFLTESKRKEILASLYNRNYYSTIKPILDECYKHDWNELKMELIPEKINSKRQISELVFSKIKVEAFKRGLSYDFVDSAADQLYEELEKIYLSKENLCRIIKENSPELFEQLMDILKETDLSKLFISLKAMSLVNLSPEFKEAFSRLLEFRMKEILEAVFSVDKKLNQGAPEIKEINRKILELKERFKTSPSELQKDKEFKKQYDQTMASLTRERKALLNGTGKAAQFLRENDPEILLSNMETVFERLGCLKDTGWKLILENAHRDPNFAMGKYPEWM